MTRNEIPAKTTDLRKFAAQLGIKGMSSARKEQLLEKINAHFDAIEAEEAKVAKPAKKEKKAKKVGAKATTLQGALGLKGICAVCSTAKVNMKTQGKDSTMCTVCYDEAGIENEHQDGVHEAGTHTGCNLCFPVEVPQGPHTSTSYKFAKDALRKGWTVTVTDLCEGEGHMAAFQVEATKGDVSITLTWRQRAFQYYTKESFRQTGEKKALILNASQAHSYL